MSIYIVSHLRLKPPHDPGHRIMYVGPLSGQSCPAKFAVTDADLSPHIAHKNQTYCELTALQQVARRHPATSEDVVGLVHYRRRFVNGPKWLSQIIRSTQKSRWTRPFSNALLEKHELTQSKAAKLLNHCDVIVPRLSRLKESIEQRYVQSHHGEDWYKLRQLLVDQFPDYVPAFEQCARGHSIHHFNMFVANSAFLQHYTPWLFSILDQLESQIDLSGRDHFQIRVFGFLAERLFNVYLLKHTELTVLHLPIVQLFNESVVASSPAAG